MRWLTIIIRISVYNNQAKLQVLLNGHINLLLTHRFERLSANYRFLTNETIIDHIIHQSIPTQTVFHTSCSNNIYIPPHNVATLLVNPAHRSLYHYTHSTTNHHIYTNPGEVNPAAYPDSTMSLHLSLKTLNPLLLTFTLPAQCLHNSPIYMGNHNAPESKRPT